MFQNSEHITPSFVLPKFCFICVCFSKYGEGPKILNTLFHIFLSEFSFLYKCFFYYLVEQSDLAQHCLHKLFCQNLVYNIL